MKILVAGGAGFIGSHFCEFLLNKGHEVICVDNFFTGNKKNISHLLKNRNFELIRHDIIQPIYLEVNQIYNLACPASPIHYQWDPIKTLLTSTVGMYNMLGIAKRCKAKILQASTSEIYGDPNEHPQKESYWGNVNPIGPRSCYDEGKRAAETFMIDYHKENNVNIRIVRIFNTYGPRMSASDGRVVSNFITQALKDENITIFGDGSHTRSFQYVDDLIEAMTAMMDTDDDFTGPVNIGNPAEYRIIDLARKIIELTGSGSRITYLPLPEDDPQQRQPDITLAGRVLGWNPSVDLEEGLGETIAYFKKELNI